MSEPVTRIDKDLVCFLAKTILRVKGLDNRRKAIKEVSEIHGGNNRQQLELAIKNEIDRLWIGRKT